MTNARDRKGMARTKHPEVIARHKAVVRAYDDGAEPGIGRTTMHRPIASNKKALVLEAFDTLFNKRDSVAAERYWSPNYLQHSAHIGPGREGLLTLVKSLPPELKYEPGLIVAEGDLVMIHGRFSGFGHSTAWIAADILRLVDGVLTEHWDVIQDGVRSGCV